MQFRKLLCLLTCTQPSNNFIIPKGFKSQVNCLSHHKTGIAKKIYCQKKSNYPCQINLTWQYFQAKNNVEADSD